MTQPAGRPVSIGGRLAPRQLHFIWIVDCSASMETDGKIEALNNGIRDAIPHMRDVADRNPHAELMVRVIKFSTGAEWHVAQPTPIEQFRWADLTAAGVTDLGKALKMVAAELNESKMSARELKPVLALISDGMPTDDFKGGLKELMAQTMGRKAKRVAIAIGRDVDIECLQKFIGNNEEKPIQAHETAEIAACIQYVSTAVVQEASQPKSRAVDGPKGQATPPNLNSRQANDITF